MAVQPHHREQAQRLAARPVDRDPAVPGPPVAAGADEQRHRGQVEEVAALEVDQDSPTPGRATERLAQALRHREVELTLDPNPAGPGRGLPLDQPERPHPPRQLCPACLSFAAAFTQRENGVPFSPLTCFLLMPLQA